MKTMRKFIVLTLSLFLFSYVNVFAQTDVMAKVEKFIETKYHKSLTLDVDSDKGNVEVEIIDDGRKKDLVFNSKGEWQSTSFEMSKSELPRKIKEALKDSKYSSYSIDEIEFYETPKQSYYKIELDKVFSDDITVYVSTSGKFF